MPPPPYETILLDLDGTLVDSSDAIVDGVLAVAAEAGLPVPDRAWARSFIGQPPDTVWKALGAPDPGALVEAFGREVRPILAARTTVLPGVVEGVAALAGAGYVLAVATTRKTYSAEEALRATGLHVHVRHASGRDRVAHPKPAPDVLLDALQAVGGRPDRALMIGDSDADVLAARAAGMPCWALLGGMGKERALREAGADLILSGGFAEVPARLGLVVGDA